jgi:hypothetical protein
MCFRQEMLGHLPPTPSLGEGTHVPEIPRRESAIGDIQECTELRCLNPVFRVREKLSVSVGSDGF